MSLTLYGNLGSPAVRSTLLCIRAIGIKDKVKIENVELFKGDNLKPEFVKKNPLHTIPLLEDGKLELWDSHAINSYLVNKYATDDALYPTNPEKRALIDAMNHFDTGYLFARCLALIKAVFKQDKTANLGNLEQDIRETLDLLEKILENRTFVAGDTLSIADFSIVTTVSTVEIIIERKLDQEKYKHICTWYAKMKTLPYYSINEQGSDVLKKVFTQLKSSL